MRTALLAGVFTAVMIIGLGGCREGDEGEMTSKQPTRTTAEGEGTEGVAPGGRGLLEEAPEAGVRLHLSDAPLLGPAAQEHVSRPPATPLASSEVEALLRRLPPLEAGQALQVDFALKPGPKPPPLSGDQVLQPFPPPAGEEGPPAIEAVALEVVRYQPQGDLEVGSHLSVTFSEPMVPLTSHEVLSAAEVPVQLDPQPDGEWRWVGSRTLLFEPEGRFPMATEYRAEVPAGTQALSGAALADAVSWVFRTPPPSVVTMLPQDSPTELRPLIVMVFDQRVDAEAVLAHTTLSVDGDDVPLRLAGKAEIDADKRAARVTEDADVGRFVAFVPEGDLPLAGEAELVIGPGLSSAEGPLVTQQEQRFNFQVHGPLQVESLQCSGEGDAYKPSSPGAPKRGCGPLEPLRIEFNNVLDPGAFDPNQLKVEPDIEGVVIEARGKYVVVQGQTRGRTQYTVTLPATLRDQYGGTLDEEVEVVFETGDMPRTLVAPRGDAVVLDPTAPPALHVLSVNNDTLDVRLFQVTPDDWRAFDEFAAGYGRALWEGRNPKPPFAEVWNGTIEPGGDRDTLVDVPIDLGPALEEGTGHVVVQVSPQHWTRQDLYGNSPRILWVQATQLGLDVFADGDEVLAWVTSLTDGRPVQAAQVVLQPAGTRATTDDSGLATLEAPPVARTEGAGSRRSSITLEARRGGDSTFVVDSYGYSWSSSPGSSSLRWYVLDDRGLYRPGEVAYIKGWLRRDSTAKGGDLAALDGSIDKVRYTFTAPNGADIASGEVDLDEYGGFHLLLDVPQDVELGDAQLTLEALGDSVPEDGHIYNHRLPISEFRRPEFEVKVQAGSPSYFLDQQGVAEVSASYYAGGALPGAEVDWSVTASPTDYSPPGHDDFVFGIVRPWWGFYGEPWSEGAFEQHTAVTDATGTHRLAVDIDSVEPLSAVAVSAEATVMDVNRQAWSARAPLLFHPASAYVGLRPKSWFATEGEPFEIAVIVADLAGELVEGAQVEIRAEKVTYAPVGEVEAEQLELAAECEVVSALEPSTCELSLEQPGRYRISARSADADGRPNLTRLDVWVPGGHGTDLGTALELEEVILVPAAESFEPGATAQIMVQAPFAPAEGLLTVRRQGIVSTERFRMEGETAVLDVPIEDAYVPNVQVQIDLVGAAPRTDGDAGTGSVESSGDLSLRPAFATGSVEIGVLPNQRTLTVTTQVDQDKVVPGSDTLVRVTVHDAHGTASKDASVALVVVDEAVLALTGHQIPDPMEVLYPQRPPGVNDTRQRSMLQLAPPLDALDAMNAEGGGGGDIPARAMAPLAGGVEAAEMDQGLQPAYTKESAGPMLASAAPEDSQSAPVVTERTDLDPVAAFEPQLVTDADGSASVTIHLPDSVTRYRITAVATDGGQRFGKGESQLVARLPLIVRPSAPRFLNYGDQLELPVVVQNQTDEELVTEVVVRSRNMPLSGEAGDVVRSDDGSTAAGLRVTVPANDRVEVRFPAAADMPGTAAFQTGAFSASLADAQRVSLPVWTPATTEAFATYGVLDEGALAQPVLRPPDVEETFGGLTITSSSTALSALTDAFLYLQTYPYEGSEQIASRMLATVSLADVLTAFGAAELPPRSEIDAAVDRDIARLVERQGSDGGFDWWMPRDESSPIVTIHVANAFARAQAKGYDVPPSALEPLLRYLRDIQEHLDRRPYQGRSRWALEAYALQVRMLLGDRDPAAARELFGRADDPSVETLGWLLATLSGDPESDSEIAEIHRQLGNRVAEEAGTAQFTQQYAEEDGNLILASDRRADAVVLEAMIGDSPESDLIPKLVAGLLGHRVKGRWDSTQENAFVLLALDRYFREYEDVEPDFVARAWLGDGYAGEHEFRGHTAESSVIEVPMAVLSPEGDQVVLAKEGQGRLYYRMGLRYAPSSLELEPLERGFSVERRYEAVDDAEDVRRTADGSWEIKAGARVRVKLTMAAPQRRYHVALVDPLPAGLEAVNPDLAVSGSAVPQPVDPDEPVARPWRPWRWSWYDHDAFRDERVEAFAGLLSPGVYSYSYIARATTPGRFVVPPAKAEEMYHPETFGRTSSEVVVVSSE